MKSFLFIVLASFFISTTSAQEITMFSGFTGYKYYQDDKEIDKKDLSTLFDKNEEVQGHWKKAKSKEIVAAVAITAEMGFAVWMTLELLNNDSDLGGKDKVKNAVAPAVGVLGTGIIGGIFMYASNNSKKKAILTYNKQFDNQTTFRVVPVSSQNGIGLALKF